MNQVKTIISEFNKIIWPNSKNTLSSTKFTLFLLVTSSIFIWLTDVSVQAVLRQ